MKVLLADVSAHNFNALMVSFLVDKAFCLERGSFSVSTNFSLCCPRAASYVVVCALKTISISYEMEVFFNSFMFQIRFERFVFKIFLCFKGLV